MNKNQKIMISIVLGIIIIALTLFLFINGEELFKNKVTLTYPDGCSETYSDGVLITEPCPNNNDLGITLEIFNNTDEYNG